MDEKLTATLEKIQEAALTEFLDKGFLGASLRQIVKNAGVTTGAFYGYFSSKEALFASIVEPHAKALMGRFMEAQTSFAELPEEQQPGRDVPELSRSLCHIIASGMFSGLFEIVVHDMPREQAQRDVEQFRQFYTGGWLTLMGG